MRTVVPSGEGAWIDRAGLIRGRAHWYGVPAASGVQHCPHCHRELERRGRRAFHRVLRDEIDPELRSKLSGLWLVTPQCAPNEHDEPAGAVARQVQETLPGETCPGRRFPPCPLRLSPLIAAQSRILQRQVRHRAAMSIVAAAL